MGHPPHTILSGIADDLENGLRQFIYTVPCSDYTFM